MSLALFALFAAAFGFGTTEFIVSGLLPKVSDDLQVGIPTAGLLITGFAIGGGLGGPILTILTSRLSRKSALLSVVGVFVVSHMLAAIASGYAVLMAARVVTGASWGAYFGIAGVVATRVVPENRKASAIAVIGAGIAVANIVGVPGGTALGQVLGWRAALWVIAAVGVIAGAAIAIWVPSATGGPEAKVSLSREIAVIGRQQIVLALIANVLLCISFFGVFTYVAPLLVAVTGVAPGAVPGFLLVFGVGATIGVLAGGRIGDWKLMPSIIGLFAAQAFVYGLMLVIGQDPILMGVAILLMGATGFGVTAPLQARILKSASDAPNLASSLAQSAFNAGIAIGAWAGGVLLSFATYRALPWLGLVFALAAAGIAALSIGLERRAPRPCAS